ncbi:MAG: spore germination protein [Bacilli bacterium]|nr:spore germination protein [Bacilli bacterium]MDD4733948.1 spore germination protein [Bacilli bacterium]
MEKLLLSIKENKEQIKIKTNNSPDIVFKDMKVFNTNICVVANEALSDKNLIDKYILRYLTNSRMLKDIKIKNLVKFLNEYIPAQKITIINNFEDFFQNLFSGFCILLIDGYNEALAIEMRISLDSGINTAQNEQMLKGPRDAFTENYQTNIGLVRKRIRTENLWLEEMTLGSLGKTKIGVMYIRDIASQELVDQIVKKIKDIKIDTILDSNYVIEMISKNKKSVFPNYISTERPDNVSGYLLDGRIAIIVENTPYAVIIPALFLDFFHVPSDNYQKSSNVTFTRLTRILAFMITLFLPAIYIALSTYNFEAIPERLLISFAAQKEGVPFPTIIEVIMMIVTFEILKESDTRTPQAIGGSLSIVGALVLGEAAVAAGIVSPITIIVVAVTSICGMIIYSFDVVNGVRRWRTIFLLLSGIAGLIGFLVALTIFIINVSSIKSFGIPYLSPFAPFKKENLGDSIIITNKRKFEKRNVLTAKKQGRQ